jgi:hypothetical protein
MPQRIYASYNDTEQIINKKVQQLFKAAALFIVA